MVRRQKCQPLAACNFARKNGNLRALDPIIRQAHRCSRTMASQNDPRNTITHLLRHLTRLRGPQRISFKGQWDAFKPAFNTRGIQADQINPNLHGLTGIQTDCMYLNALSGHYYGQKSHGWSLGERYPQLTMCQQLRDKLSTLGPIQR